MEDVPQVQASTQSGGSGGSGCGGCLTVVLLITAVLWFTDGSFKDAVIGRWRRLFPESSSQVVAQGSVTFKRGKPTYLLYSVGGQVCEVDAATYDRDSVATHMVVVETCDWRPK